jgi:hypothetical protein
MYSGEKQDASACKKSMVLGSGSPGPSGKMNKAMLLLCVLGLIRIIPPPASHRPGVQDLRESCDLHTKSTR